MDTENMSATTVHTRDICRTVCPLRPEDHVQSDSECAGCPHRDATVIDALNADPGARDLLQAFEDTAARLGHAPDSAEYRVMRGYVLCVALLGNQQARDIMAAATYHSLRRKLEV